MDEIKNLACQKLIKDEGYVMSIQHAFEHENLSDFRESLEQKMQAKQDEIKRYCSDNYTLMIENFFHYSKVRQQVAELDTKMSTFIVKLEKIHKGNQYDTRLINLKRTQIINIVAVQKNIQKVKDALILAKKSVSLSQSEKMTSSIRNVEKIKVHSLVSKSNNLTQVTTILLQVPPLIYKRVQNEADMMISRWIAYSKHKQQEIGSLILQQCEQLLRALPSSSRLSMGGGGERQSIMFDRSSILGQSTAPNRSSRIRASVMPGNRTQSFFDPANRSGAQRMSFANRMSTTRFETKDILSQDFKIDFSSLKQPQFIYETMKQKALFISQLKTQRQRLIFSLCEAEQVGSVYDFHGYLGQVVGFLVVDREIAKIFREYDQSTQLMLDSFKIIEKQVRLIFQRLPPEDLLQLKRELQQFSFAIGKLGILSIQHSTNKLLRDSFVVFCRRRITPIKVELNRKILADGFQNVKTNSRDDFDQYAKIFQLAKPADEPDDFQLYLSNRGQSYDLPFSSMVADTVNYVNNFIEESILYLQGLSDFDESVIMNLDSLYIEISDVVKNFILQQGKEKDPMQLCQLGVNIGCLETSISYYRKQIENYLQLSSNREFQAIVSFKDCRYKCEETITALLNAKTQQQLSQLSIVNWEPQVPNKGPHDFFEMLVGYLESMFSTISFVLPSFVDSAIYLTFKFINQLIWKILLESVRAFNILGLANLNQDILCLTRLCNTTFQKHPNENLWTA